MPLVPSFTLRLKDEIHEGLATMGRYDGKRPTLTGATAGGKIFMHNPRGAEEDGGEVTYLNINKKITAVSSGCLDGVGPGGKDVLLVGTATDLLAYDVDDNKDRFHVDMGDGVSALACGSTGAMSAPMAIIGGGSSVQGFDAYGEEVFWTVAGDRVGAVALRPSASGESGANDLLVGSDDFAIRTFHGEEVVAEVTEADRVTHLAPLEGERFAYALANGTVGVYDGTHREWRVRSKNRVAALSAHDLDADGVPEVVAGWSGGKLEVRDPSSGAIVYKDTFAGGVASVLSADYRGDGSGADMVVCALDGEVRGYRARAEEDGLRGGGGFVDEAPRDNLAAAGGAPPEEKKKKASFFGSGFKMRSSKKESKDDEGAGSSASRSFPPAQKAPAPQGSRADLADGDAQEETLVALNQRRQDLLIELKSYERNAAAIEAAGFRGETATSGQIPRDTKVESRLEMRPEHGGGELVLRTNNDTVIKAAVLFGESVFEEEIRFVHFGNQPSSEARVSIRPPRDVAADLAIKALVAGRSSPTYHVFELDFKIPRFCMYAPLVGPVAPEDVPSGTVTFRTPERVTRIAAWVDDAFKTNYSGELGGDDDADLRCGFFCLRDETRLLLEVDANSGTTVVRADVMETAGDFVQEMCASLGVEELQSEVDFPYDMEEFRETLKRVEDRDRDRGRLAAETADSSNAIKAFVIKAEDARILNDTTNMRRMYGELFDLNRELIVEHGKRAENHEELLAALREVNQMIQRAAKMRAGRAKTKVVAACRKAIKQNNTQALFQIIAHGAEEAE